MSKYEKCDKKNEGRGGGQPFPQTNFVVFFALFVAHLSFSSMPSTCRAIVSSKDMNWKQNDST